MVNHPDRSCRAGASLRAFLTLAIALLCVTPASAQAMRNGLPPVSMDSFVYEARENAEAIYGDESCNYAQGQPTSPYNGFELAHRINTGIAGRRDEGLTTGHGSYLPTAFGADEFLRAPGEWSQSGRNGGTAFAMGLSAPVGSSGGGGGAWRKEGNGSQSPWTWSATDGSLPEYPNEYFTPPDIPLPPLPPLPDPLGVLGGMATGAAGSLGIPGF